MTTGLWLADRTGGRGQMEAHPCAEGDHLVLRMEVGDRVALSPEDCEVLADLLSNWAAQRRKAEGQER